MNGDYDDYAVTIERPAPSASGSATSRASRAGLADAIGQLQPNQNATPNYAVKEGELIGYTGQPTANGIDVWVENDNSL